MVISPGSVSIIEVEKEFVQVKAINIYGHQEEFFEEFLNGDTVKENYLS